MYVICLQLKDTSEVQPLAWTAAEPSNKQIKRAVKQFRKDADVSGGCAMEWDRLYSTKQETKKELPQYA